MYEHRLSLVVLAACGAILTGCGDDGNVEPVSDQYPISGRIVISAQANIFGAGHDSAPAPAGGGPGKLPAMIGIPLDTGLVLAFTRVHGKVSCCDGVSGTYNGPDGGTNYRPTNLASFGNISGIFHSSSTMFVVGVFLKNGKPLPSAPARLNYTGPDTASNQYPILNQTFFIGDGLTDKGTTQRFHIPAGAARLYLGFADGYAFNGPPGYFGDNRGSIIAWVRIWRPSAIQGQYQGACERKDPLVCGAALRSLSVPTSYAETVSRALVSSA